MKKKTLITLMVVVLSLTIALTAFACDRTPPPGPGPTPPPPPPTAKFGDVFDAIFKSADKVIDNFAGVEDAAYYAFTGYVEIENGTGTNMTATKLEITVKGNFDSETIAKNGGFIEIKDTADNKVVLAVYVAQSTVYIGESFTKAPTTAKPLNWVKLSQVDSSNFIANFFGGLPAVLEGFLGKFEGENLFTGDGDVADMIGMVRALGSNLFDYEYPTTFVKDTNVDGDYTIGIKMDRINDILPLLGEFISGLSDDMLDMINMVLPTLLGVTMERVGDSLEFVEEGLTPTIELDFSIAGGALSQFGISYAKTNDPDTEEDDAISVKFGLKNVVAESAARTLSTLAPSYMPAVGNIGDGAIKLSIELDLDQKDLGPVTLDAYLVPDISVGYTEGDWDINLDDLKIYGVATFDGQSAELAVMYNAEYGTLAFDLAGLYELLGEEPEGGTVYYNSTLDLYGLFGIDAPDASNVSNDPAPDPVYTNVIDKLIKSINESEDMLGLITDNVGTVLDIAKGLMGIISGSIESEEGVAVLDVLGLMDALASYKLKSTDTDLFLDSEFLKLFCGGQFPTYYLDTDNIMSAIVDASGKTVAEIEEIVCEYTGIELGAEQSLVAYLEANGLYVEIQGFIGETATNGAGFQMTLKAGTAPIAKVGITAQLVTYSEVTTAVSGLDIYDFNFAAPVGIDLNDDANWDAFLDELSVLLDAYRRLGADVA